MIMELSETIKVECEKLVVRLAKSSDKKDVSIIGWSLKESNR